MIFTVSTVKDTLPNVQRFVAGNLANGVDHLFVLLDAEAPEVQEFLTGHEQVTCVRTDKSWWHGERPAALNDRQRINANVVKVLLSAFEWADWLFHIDADEIALIDRGALDALPAEQRVVRLNPLEAVAQMTWDGDPTYFKRLLKKGDLTLLQVLGLLDQASNGDYFHGHVFGKVGIRPSLDLWLMLHQAVDRAKEQQEAYADDGLRLLHYESYSGDDFIRKWTALLAAGPMASFRAAREPTAIALQTLIRKGLTEEQARPYLLRIFERTTLDDLDTLLELGLLEEHRPLEGSQQPRPLPAGAREQVEALLARLHAEPKAAFAHGADPAEVTAMLHRVGVSASEAPETRGARRFLRRS